jgi:hypothetical protein
MLQHDVPEYMGTLVAGILAVAVAALVVRIVVLVALWRSDTEPHHWEGIRLDTSPGVPYSSTSRCCPPSQLVPDDLRISE